MWSPAALERSVRLRLAAEPLRTGTCHVNCSVNTEWFVGREVLKGDIDVVV